MNGITILGSREIHFIPTLKTGPKKGPISPRNLKCERLWCCDHVCRRRKLCGVGKKQACHLRSTHTANVRHIGMQFRGNGNDSAPRSRSRQAASSYPMEVHPHWTTRAPRWSIVGTRAWDSSAIQIIYLLRFFQTIARETFRPATTKSTPVVHGYPFPPGYNLVF